MKLEKEFWDDRYLNENTGWDIGYASTPLSSYVDSIDNKNLKILIPGCGNAYEAEYLIEKKFSNITLIDISSVLTDRIKKKFEGDKRVTILNKDFFEHEGKYDLILEQTFFCSLDLSMRTEYCMKMNTLLNPDGILAGVLFNTDFGKEGPPFGGSKTEYKKLFSKFFDIKILKECYNSIQPRAGKELFFIFKKIRKK